MKRTPITAWSAPTVVAVAACVICCGLPMLAIAELPPPPPTVTRPNYAPPLRPAPCNLYPGEVLEGRYLCGQGDTGVRLEVLEVHGRSVHAAFDFNWERGGITGRFTMRGTCDPATHTWLLHPEAWQRQPPGWIMVGIDGTLTPDGSQYTGRMMHPSCGYFSVTRTR